MQASRQTRTNSRLLGGGTAGNELLTNMTGSLLLVLLAVLGVTILRIRQLIWLHLFLGLLLIGPITLKMLSTGYRFARYYTHDEQYVGKGPPLLVLRSIAPLVVAATITVFASGIWLMLAGPTGRSTPLLVHKASFFVWLAVTALHVLGHLPGMGDWLKTARHSSTALGSDAAAGSAGRWLALTGVVVGGAVLAVVLIPHFSLWTAPGAFPHHHGH